MLPYLLQNKKYKKIKRVLWLVEFIKNKRKRQTDPEGVHLNHIIKAHPLLLNYKEREFKLILDSFILKAHYYEGVVSINIKDFEALDIYESDFIYFRDEGVISNDKNSFSTGDYYVLEKDIYNWLGSWKYISIIRIRKNLYTIIPIVISIVALVFSVYSTYCKQLNNKELIELKKENKQLKLNQ